MAACSNYTPHKWREDTCSECFQKKANHVDNQTITIIESTGPPGSLDIIKESSPADELNRRSPEFNPQTVATPTKSDEPSAADSVNNSRSSPSPSSSLNKLPPCRYTMNCYRQNPFHFQKYSHPPGFEMKLMTTDQVRRSSPEQEISLNELPHCHYGKNCYRRNPFHFQQYFHPPDLMKKSTTSDQVKELPSKQEHTLHIADATDSEKHIRLAKERFRASMADAEAKNKNYEEQIKKLEYDLKKMAEYHQQLEYALGKEIDKRERIELEKKKVLSVKRDTPNYWGINAFEMPYREVYIHENSKEFQMINQLLNDTIESHDNNYGTIYGRDPTEFIVTKICRIQNEKLWHEYCFKKVCMKKNSLFTMNT